jgi:hypothetical protein
VNTPNESILLRIKTLLGQATGNGTIRTAVDNPLATGGECFFSRLQHVLSVDVIPTKKTVEGTRNAAGELTIAVLVEQGEGLLEFSNLFFCELVSHGY